MGSSEKEADTRTSENDQQPVLWTKVSFGTWKCGAILLLICMIIPVAAHSLTGKETFWD